MKKVVGRLLWFFLVLFFLGLMASYYQPEVSKSYERSNKVNLPGFLYELEMNGKKAWLAFFKSWTGYEHPVVLEGAISYEETQQLKAYYLAYFQGEQGAELLVRVDKVLLMREPYIAMIGQELRGDGLALNQVLEADEEVGLGKTVTLEETINMARYFELDLLPDAPPKDVRLVSKEIDYSYHYEYDAKGALSKAVIASGGKTQTIDYSQRGETN